MCTQTLLVFGSSGTKNDSQNLGNAFSTALLLSHYKTFALMLQPKTALHAVPLPINYQLILAQTF